MASNPSARDGFSRGPARPARFPHPGTCWIVTGAGAALFLVSALVVRAGATGPDARLYRVLNDVPTSLARVLTPFARVFSPPGLAVAAIAVAVYVVVRNRSGLPLLVGVAAAGSAWLLANLAKAVAERPRPYVVMADAVLRQSPAHGTSFPSSHTAVALATAIALIPFLARPAAVVAVAYAVMVGWSRVYLGVHYPLDVVGGAGIGMTAAGLILLAAARMRRDVRPVAEGA